MRNLQASKMKVVNLLIVLEKLALQVKSSF